MVVDAVPPETAINFPSSPGSQCPLPFVSVQAYSLNQPGGLALRLAAKSAPGYRKNWPKLAFTRVFPRPVTSYATPTRGPQLFHTTAPSMAANDCPPGPVCEGRNTRSRSKRMPMFSVKRRFNSPVAVEYWPVVARPFFEVLLWYR